MFGYLIHSRHARAIKIVKKTKKKIEISNSIQRTNSNYVNEHVGLLFIRVYYTATRSLMTGLMKLGLLIDYTVM